MLSTNIASREVAELVLAEYDTGRPFLRLDYANVTTAELTSARVIAYGGPGRAARVPIDGRRGGTLTVETQITPMALFTLLSGGEPEGASRAFRRHCAQASALSVTLPGTPEGTVYVFRANDDCGVPITSSVSGKVVSVPSAGDYVIYYNTGAPTAQRAAFGAKCLPKACVIYGETSYRTETGLVNPCRIIAYHAVPRADMTCRWANSGEAAQLKLVFDMFEDDDGRFFELALEDSNE